MVKNSRIFALVALLNLAFFEFPLWAHFVEKLTFAIVEIAARNSTRAPFWSGFARLLRCRKDLGQFAEVLGGGGEEEFVICAAWAT